MSSLIATVVSAQAGGTAVVIGAVVYALRKFLKDKKAVAAVEKVVAHDLPHGVAVAVEDAVKFVAHLVESPLLAGVAASGKLEAHHVLAVLSDTRAVSEAKTILLGVGKVYNSLTADEKVKVEVMLRLALSALGIHLTDAQVQGVFADAQKQLDALASDATFKAMFVDNKPAPAEPAPAATA